MRAEDFVAAEISLMRSCGDWDESGNGSAILWGPSRKADRHEIAPWPLHHEKNDSCVVNRSIRSRPRTRRRFSRATRCAPIRASRISSAPRRRRAR